MGGGWHPSNQTMQHEYPTTPERIPRKHQHIQEKLPLIPKIHTSQVSSMESQTTIISQNPQKWDLYCIVQILSR